MNEKVIGSRKSARIFQSDKPYAVISFVGHDFPRSPPALAKSPNFRGRITIRANDVYAEPHTAARAMTSRQADRIARFVRRIAPQIETLFIHCRYGHGRSAAAAIAIARAFGLPWEPFSHNEYEQCGNGHVTMLLVRALERLGYDCGTGDPGEYDVEYVQKRSNGLLIS